MASLNQAVLLGRLGADPKLTHTKGGTAVTNLRVATSLRWKNKDGEMEESTEWHDVVVWGPQAERCAEFLAKGRLVLIVGRIHTRPWTDAEDRPRYSTEIVASSVEFVDRPKESAA